MIILFDTCIILDYLLNREGFADMAEQLLILSAEGELHGVITAKSLMDIHYFLRHTLHSEEKTRKILSTLTDALYLIDSTAKDALNAMSSDIADYEDALMEATAMSFKADGIVTRNIRDYKASRVKIYDPFDLLTQTYLGG